MQRPELRPILVDMPSSTERALASGYSEVDDCLMELTSYDLAVLTRQEIEQKDYPSWTITSDNVEITPIRRPGESAKVFYVIGTLDDLALVLQRNLGARRASLITITVPAGDELRTCIFIIGACRI